MNIASDFDDVMFNFALAFARAYRIRHPEKQSLVAMDFDRFDLCEVGKITTAEKYALFDHIRQKFNYAYEGAPVDVNFDYYIKKLLEDGHTIYILTGNPEYVNPQIHAFLEYYGLPKLSIQNVSSMREKMDASWDLLVDDSPELAELTMNDPRHFLLYGRPHNMTQQRKVKHRVMNWGEIYRTIKALEGSSSASATSSPTT